MPRCFYALGLPTPDATALGVYTESLDGRLRRARMRPLDVRDLHITLRFLGAVDDARIPVLIDTMAGIASEFGPLPCRVSGVALWPNAKAPRVLVTGIRCDGPMQDLAARFEAMAEALRFPPERRRFRAHVTLARFPAGAVAVQGALPPPPERAFQVEALHLMESLTRPGQPRYRSLAHAMLGTGP